MESFKKAIKIKVNKVPPFYQFGERRLNIWHTCLRNDCSQLNADLYRCNIVEDPSCLCGFSYENRYHFFLVCPNYTAARVKLFDDLNRDVNLDTLLNGSENLSIEENYRIFKLVQKYIKDTGRFK